MSCINKWYNFYCVGHHFSYTAVVLHAYESSEAHTASLSAVLIIN